MEKEISENRVFAGNINLTVREKEILKCIIKGYTNPQIAKKYNIAVSTVKAHVSAIIKKFKVVNRIEVVAFAIKNNICG